MASIDRPYEAMRRYLDWAMAHPFSKRTAESFSTTVRLYDNPFAVGFGGGLQIVGSPQLDMVSTTPGGLSLMAWGLPPYHPDMPILNLGLAHDLPDGFVTSLRDSVVAALIDVGVPFMPVSVNGFGRAIVTDFGRVQLVARTGLQCVLVEHRATRDVYFVSGFDDNETPPLYFLAELPCPVSTYAEAIEALKPRSVKMAEALGMSVLRQGDMFAIATKFGTDGLREMGATMDTTITRQTKRPFSTAISFGGDGLRGTATRKTMTTRRRGLYGTAHTATELARLPDGTMFARGALIHDPLGVLGEHRMPDHDKLPLPGECWYLVARNTVPVTKQERR